MTLEDMRAEWETCRIDDPDKATVYEDETERAYCVNRGTRRWYILLLDRAQAEGWNDHPLFKARYNLKHR